MIDFGPMHAEGYASIEKEDFDWGLPGLNIIQADNGSGKTTFINALVWCLYGKPLSGSVEPWAHVRPSSYCGTKVSQIFMVDGTEYKVTRFKDYPKFKNSLLLSIDGDDPEEGGKVEIQEKINEILGYSYELFKNAIIFGQKLKRIISETGPNKKQVFDDAFEVTYLSIAKKLAGEKSTEFRKELTKAENSHAILQEKVLGKESEISSQEQLVKNFEHSKNQEIEEWKNLIKAHKKDYKKIKDSEDIEGNLHIQELELEIFEKDAISNEEIIILEKQLTRREADRDNEDEKALEIHDKIEEIKYNIANMPGKCDSCGKPYTPSEQKEAKRILKKFLEKREKAYKAKKNTIGEIKGHILEDEEAISSATKLLESIDIINKEIERLEELKSSMAKYKKKIKGCRDQINKIKAQKLKNNLEKLSVELSDLQEQAKASAREVRKIQKDVDTYDWLVKDPLSNAGLRAFIFNMMLDDVNERLEYYTSFIGLQVAFVMDMQSAHKNLDTFVFAAGEPVPYGDLSGGQQQAVDIVTAFAIHDVVADSKECSLLVMDEVFESLDKSNIEIMSELIQDKATHKCLYLVTHRAEFNPTNANIIKVHYTDYVSSLA